MEQDYLNKAKALKEERLAQIYSGAVKLYKKFGSPYSLQRKFLNILEKRNIQAMIIIPELRNDEDVLEEAVWGSGSFSTGEEGLHYSKKMFKELGYFPIKPVVIVSNRNKEHGSNARNLAKTHNLPLIELDFVNWYRSNYDSKSQNPIAETRFFYPPGSRNVPPMDRIEYNFNIRKEFHDELVRLIEEELGYLPHTHSLRGYSFPIMSEIGQVDDTHPGDLAYVNPETKHLLYPGWQSGPVMKMLNHKLKFLRGALISVDPIIDVSQYNTVDTGFIFMRGPGHTIPDNLDLSKSKINETAKAVQNAMKFTDDIPMLATKSCGLFPYLWAITREEMEISYLHHVPWSTISNSRVEERIERADGISSIKQQGVIVGDRILSGKDAFCSNLEKDLTQLLEILLHN
jgi:hypothetical protein